MEAGVQPLDALMSEADLNNHALVAVSTLNLTHKQVGKARRGRRLTMKLQKKVLQAWNAAQSEPRELSDLFTYKGK